MDLTSAASRMLAGLSAAVAALTAAVYIALIQYEGDNALWEIFPWLMIMLIGTTLALAAAFTRNRGVTRFSAGAAATVLGLLGLVAIFSVGLGFILAALLALVAAVIPSAATAQVS